MELMALYKGDFLWYTLSVSSVEGFSHYGDHSFPTWCNLITVDLGIPRLCPRGAGAEYQPGTSCLRRQEHQTRQMAHKSWRCMHRGDGRPSSGEHTVSRWAEGASTLALWVGNWCHTGWAGRENMEHGFHIVSKHFKVRCYSMQELSFGEYLICIKVTTFFTVSQCKPYGRAPT